MSSEHELVVGKMGSGGAPAAAEPNPWKWLAALVGATAGLTVLCIGILKVGPIGGGGDHLSIDPNRIADVKHGQKVYAVSCATCHGGGGKGMPHQGAPLVNSAFVETASDQQLITMIKVGRTADDPKSVMRLPMPAKGGYSNLTDEDLHDVVAYIRQLGTGAKPAAKQVAASQ
jgi:mono/diheme cytochrome c family protein